MQLVTADKIAAVMGLTQAPQSMAGLEDLVAKGLPKSALKASVERVEQRPAERRALLYKIIPEATYKRRRDRLTPEESERAERLARTYATAQHVWNSDADALTFLHTSNRSLQGRTPLAVSMSELGARRVEQLLWQIFYGLGA